MKTCPQDYHRIATSIANRVQQRHALYHLFDDLVGLAVVGLLEADATYDPSRASSHFGHLYVTSYRYVLDNLHSLTGVRRNAARSRGVLFTQYDPSRHEPTEDGTEDRLQRCLDIEAVKAAAMTLPTRERVAIEAHLAGTYSADVTAHGHHRRVRNAVQLLRKALKVAA